MAQRMSLEDSRQDGRSVLGMLEVQVERDPKTGATIVKSVAPISSATDAQTSTTIFDDGRKSIHTLGDLGDEPSTKELGEILSVINDVGMTVLLDEVAVTPNKTEITTRNVESSKIEGDKLLSLLTHNSTSKEAHTQLESSGNKLDVGRMKQSASVRNPNQEAQVVTNDTAEMLDDIEGQNLEEGPVTLVFLGYTDETPENDPNQEDYEGMLTAERVIITEDGEEHRAEPETSFSLQSPLKKEGEKPAEEKTQDTTLRDVALDDHEAEPETQREDSNGNEAKQKKCRCCSVM